MRTELLTGALAGAAGIVALNTLTYLDMAVRARPASSTPAQTARRLAELARVDLGAGEAADNRFQGVGPLLGLAIGVGTGAAFGLARTRMPRPPLLLSTVALGVSAMGASDVPMTLLGVTDPRQWGVQGWLADVLPHLGYGLVTAAVYDALTSAVPPSRPR